MPTPYEILGVSKEATRDEVQHAYRTLAQIYHPDRYREASASVRREAERRMKELTAAYYGLARQGNWVSSDQQEHRSGASARSRPSPARRLIDQEGGVVYTLPSELLHRLHQELLRAEIPHEFDEAAIEVPKSYEARVDSAVARLTRSDEGKATSATSSSPPPDMTWDVRYDLSKCSGPQRQRWCRLLEEARIPYQWEKGELVVNRWFEIAVDQILGQE